MRLTHRSSRGLAATLFAAACAGAPHRPAPLASAGDRQAAGTGGHALTGVVRDARSDALLADAQVVLLADSGRGLRPVRGAVTDRQGRYRVEAIPAGGYLIRVQRIGYFADTVRVQVGDCGYVVRSERSVSYCEDSRNFYIMRAARS